MHHTPHSARSSPGLTSRSIAATAAVSLVLTVLVVTYPKDSLEASLFGLKLWFDVVFPALFPFFTMSEILMGLGVIRFAGVLLEPAMRPLFRIPGVGGFVVAIGLASGYPLGAKITGQVCRERLCTPTEGERLISFANTADPLFIIGAVAVGMFGMPEVGGVLVAAHYIGVLGVGFCMRFHDGGRMGTDREQRSGETMVVRAFRAMHDARVRDGRPIGQLFGDAVRSSLQSMLFIGGCIMMFSVFLRIITVAGAVEHFAAALGLLLAPVGVDRDVIVALIKGTVEITIGAEAVSRATGAGLTEKLVVASAIVAWSGLSVHAQVAAMVHGTGIRLAPYIAARFLHAVFAGAVTWALMGPLEPIAAPLITPVLAPLAAPGIEGFWNRLTTSLALMAALTAAVVGLSAVASLRRRLTVTWNRR